jgi:hypothetical protein
MRIAIFGTGGVGGYIGGKTWMTAFVICLCPVYNLNVILGCAVSPRELK